MTERSWFITGVSSGIGRALAEAALGTGVRVLGTARRDEDARAFEALAPGRSFGLVLDLDHHAQVAGVAEQAIAAIGPIDIVVNNAGRSLWSPVESTPISEARALLDTNLLGPMAVMQAFLPHFRERGSGLFVNISSGCGLFGVPGVGAYCASKFALEGLSETVAAETAQFGVRVMLVEPGAVRSRFISDNTTEVGQALGAYGPLAAGKGALEAYNQGAAMAPEEVAERIMAAVDDPPSRLVIGDDTRPAARAKFQALADLLAD
jgi:NAD(P)-dependent dehydrogenase (short-subunit alcohol dehydrogenase family)